MYNNLDKPKGDYTILKTSSNKGTVVSPWKKIVGAIKKSVIVSALDRFCSYIYVLLGCGIFARMFNGKQKYYGKSIFSSDKSKKEGVFYNFFRWISCKIEGSRILRFIQQSFGKLLSCRLRVIGCFIMSFAVYTALFAVISIFLDSTTASRFDFYSRMIDAATMLLISIPFLSSPLTVSQLITESRVCGKIIDILGFSKNSFIREQVTGKYLFAFLLGFICGVSSFIIPPVFIFGVFALLILGYAVFALPEFGVVVLFFSAPLFPTSLLIVLTILVTFAFVIKLIRGKRTLNFQRIDLLAMALGVLLILGGFISHSYASLMPSFVYTLFLLGFFLVSCCMRSSGWLYRCLAASAISGLLVAFYGIIQYVFFSNMTTAWIDSDFFEDISGRAISTLGNPNMLGEYLIMVLPVAMALWIEKKGLARKYSFVAIACLGICLILTWSRGAWLGFIFATIVLLLMWNKRAMWILVGGLFALPFMSMVLPDSIVTRFTSIGNLVDSSTSYRVYIWRGSVHMLSDYLFTGIGVGYDAWNEVYPYYTLPGIEAAPHSHNLFLQIGIDLGIFGLIFFIGVLFLCVKMSFTLFSRISASPVKDKFSHYRLAVAGPLCGLLAVLIQGLTDNSWYNFRVYLMFWLVIGLIPAFVKAANREIDMEENQSSAPKYDEDTAFIDIQLKNSNR